MSDDKAAYTDESRVLIEQTDDLQPRRRWSVLCNTGSLVVKNRRVTVRVRDSMFMQDFNDICRNQMLLYVP